MAELVRVKLADQRYARLDPDDARPISEGSSSKHGAGVTDALLSTLDYLIMR
jgi:hypothetical protein